MNQVTIQNEHMKYFFWFDLVENFQKEANNYEFTKQKCKEIQRNMTLAKEGNSTGDRPSVGGLTNLAVANSMKMSFEVQRLLFDTCGFAVQAIKECKRNWIPNCPSRPHCTYDGNGNSEEECLILTDMTKTQMHTLCDSFYDEENGRCFFIASILQELFADNTIEDHLADDASDRVLAHTVLLSIKTKAMEASGYAVKHILGFGRDPGNDETFGWPGGMFTIEKGLFLLAAIASALIYFLGEFSRRNRTTFEVMNSKSREKDKWFFQTREFIIMIPMLLGIIRCETVPTISTHVFLRRNSVRPH